MIKCRTYFLISSWVVSLNSLRPSLLSKMNRSSSISKISSSPPILWFVFLSSFYIWHKYLSAHCASEAGSTILTIRSCITVTAISCWENCDNLRIFLLATANEFQRTAPNKIFAFAIALTNYATQLGGKDGRVSAVLNISDGWQNRIFSPRSFHIFSVASITIVIISFNLWELKIDCGPTWEESTISLWFASVKMLPRKLLGPASSPVV